MTTQTREPAPTRPGEKTFFGQPRVLGNLFGVEMWERFSFFGMQGLGDRQPSTPLKFALGTVSIGVSYYSPTNEVPYFTWLGLVAIVVGVVLGALTKPIKSLMSGVR